MMIKSIYFLSDFSLELFIYYTDEVSIFVALKQARKPSFTYGKKGKYYLTRVDYG